MIYRSPLPVLFLLPLLAALTTPSYAVSADDPVCIVGAGPGGLTIAHELEAKGVSTAVFDKQPEVGGKCQEYYDGKTYHPLGALLFTNETYKNTLPLIQAANLPLTPGISMPNGWQYWLYGPGQAASNVTKEPTLTPAQIALIAVELAKYTLFWETEFAPKYTALRYVNGVPQEFTVPMATWLASQGYIALPTIMEAGMVPYGYGDITETPAIYMLQYYTPEVLSAFIGVAQSYIVDFHKVFVHYSTSVKGPIHRSTFVTHIDRAGDTSSIKYASERSSSTQRCSKVVLAFAPTLENLQAVHMSLTPNETQVFSDIDITAYWSAAVATKIAYPYFYQQSPPQPLGEPVGFLRVFNTSNIATTYSWAPIGSTISLDEATNLLTTTLTKVQAGVGIPNSTVTKQDVKAIRQWDYFPHFNATHLVEGLYDKYNALQGQQNTYFSSGLNGFETVEFAIRAGKDLVATYF